MNGKELSILSRVFPSKKKYVLEELAIRILGRLNIKFQNASVGQSICRDKTKPKDLAKNFRLQKTKDFQSEN